MVKRQTTTYILQKLEATHKPNDKNTMSKRATGGAPEHSYDMKVLYAGTVAPSARAGDDYSNDPKDGWPRTLELQVLAHEGNSHHEGAVPL